ncbi:M60 family metallopeptidase [Burkholderia stagnalis]|nr:M60 family metallopeptidase [Burkholderia stagnalis]
MDARTIMKQKRCNIGPRAALVAAMSASLFAPNAMTAAVRSPLRAVCDAVLRQAGDPSDLLRAHRRAFLTSPVQPTGLWAARDSVLTIDVTYCGPPPNHAPEAWIESIPGDGGPGLVRQRYVLRPGRNVFAVNHGGVVYFVARSQPGAGSVAVRHVSGSRPMPQFVLGRDQTRDWNAILNRGSSEPYAELVGRRMIVTMPLPVVREHVDDPAAVLAQWDRIVALAEEQYGLDRGNVYPDMATPFRHHFVTKPDGTHGDMTAAEYWLTARASHARPVLNAADLTASGWAPWTQLGVHYRMPAMAWSGQEDAASQLTPLYVQRALAQPPRLVVERAWDKVRVHLDQPRADYDALHDPLVRAAMLWQLDLAFGKNFYARLGQRYRTLPTADLPVSDAQKRQTFIVEASRVAGRNLLPFFDKWGLRADMTTRATIAAMQVAPLDKPIWNNRDDAIEYVYDWRDQALAGRIVMRKAVTAGRGFTARAEVANATGGTLKYEWAIPAGFSVAQASGPEVTLIAPADALPGAFAPLRVTVTDGRTTTTLGGSVRIIGDGDSLYDAMMLGAYGNGALRQWNSGRRGTAGDLYVYANPYRLTRDYFRLLTPNYGYFPTDATSNASWQYLGSYGGESYSPSQAYDLKTLAGQRKPIMRTWSNAKTGAIGDVYAYDNPYRGTRDYFKLLNARYGYFPVDRTSSTDWQYLDSYDGEQYLR